MSNPTPLDPDNFEPLSLDESRAIVEAAIAERLGENWRKEWLVVHNDPTLMRLNNDRTNLDFQIDLLGNVEVTERAANPVQLSGRLVVWAVLLSSLFLAFVLATVAGVFS